MGAKAKDACVGKVKQGVHSPVPMSTQVFILRKVRLHHASWWFAKTNVVILNAPASFFIPPALYAEHEVIWSGISLRSVGVSCPGCDPSQLLVHLRPAHWRSGLRNRKGLDLVQGSKLLKLTPYLEEQNNR